MEVINDLGIQEVKKIQQEFLRKLSDDGKMQKQALSMSIILTADKIVTDYLFKDGQYISLEEAMDILTDRNELSDNERCYQYIMDKIAMNPARFRPEIENVEKWGTVEHGYAIIYPAAFASLCESGKFSKAAFLSWAERKGLLQTQGGKKTKNKKVDGRAVRCVFLKLDDGLEVDENGFISVENYEQEELPF